MYAEISFGTHLLENAEDIELPRPVNSPEGHTKTLLQHLEVIKEANISFEMDV